ncbi:MAG: hypothetical protein IPK60_22280 [Sandaracinaceae bacterium]|jgi:uncharacterized protein (DUF697 family)|nr:hypothetical protein [Sandaracinaceae bacterium]
MASENSKDMRSLAKEPVLVYAAISGMAASVPLPWFDTVIARAARGSAMRRVAARRGVRLSPGARRALSKAGVGLGRAGLKGRLVRNVLTRIFPVLGIATRVEDALETVVCVLLLDHYLATAPRGSRPLETEEAERVQAAMKQSLTHGVFAALRAAPRGLWDTVREVATDMRAGDDEERAFTERLVDAVLDGVAGAPDGVSTRLASAFDKALYEGGR